MYGPGWWWLTFEIIVLFPNAVLAILWFAQYKLVKKYFHHKAHLVNRTFLAVWFAIFLIGIALLLLNTDALLHGIRK